MNSISDHVLSSDGIPIHYEVRGDGELALVFVHGWCGDRSHWREQLGPFSEKYKVVALDLAGHGESGINRNAWTMAAFGQDVAVVAQKLGLSRVVLVGHSMGGFVIVEAARQMPVHVIGLIGVDTFQIVGERHTKDEVRKSLPPPAGFEAALRTWLTQKFPPGSDPALVEQITDEMCSTPTEIAYPVHDEMMTNGQRQGEGLLELGMKTITINQSDGHRDAAAFAKHRIEVMPMPGVGHFVMLEDPKTFNRLLEEAIVKLMEPEVLK